MHVLQQSKGIFTLGDEQRRAFDAIERTSSNFFVTGRAGTGKSMLLRYLVDNTHKEAAVLAPTGVAAINVGGQTIHSFFRLRPALQRTDDKEVVKDEIDNLRKVARKLDMIIIDEVSMVSADLMDMIDAKLQMARKCSEPFGGCQVVAFGDLYQLPPVIKGYAVERYLHEQYGTEFFFGAPGVIRKPFQIIELTHPYRQEDGEFLEMLNRIRVGDVDQQLLADLNDYCYYQADMEDDGFITLTADNRTASNINAMNIDAIPENAEVFYGHATGTFPEKDYPTEERLILKCGTQVMLLNNKRDDGGNLQWVNGTIGVISSFYDDHSVVQVKVGKKYYNVESYNWERYSYIFDREEGGLVRKKVGTFSQLPMKPAYAITIHKSQGQTYDKVVVDLGRGAFADGQTYVALSRCRSMEGLALENPLRMSDIRVNPEVKKWMEENS